jgi:phosphatidylinositol-bisphosphatase
MKGALKSLFKVPSSGKMSGASSGSGTAAWEDFSTFSNAPALATGSSPSGLEAEEPHPLTKEWAERIGNRNVRAAFLEESIDGYTAAHDLRVWTGTWNTNGKAPPAGLDISPWLDVSARPDVVVVGFQEIVPLTPGKVLMQEDTAATAEWEAIIERALNGEVRPPHVPRPAAAAPPGASWTTFDDPGDAPAAAPGWTSFEDPGGAPAAARANPNPNASIGGDRATYVRLARKQLVGVYVTVWTTVDTASHARDVRAATVSTGVNLGVSVLGNKGGAAVWMKLYATPVCFICSHLSAGSKDGDEAKRSEDYGEIHDRLTFDPPSNVAVSDGSAPPRAAAVKDAFAAVWIGDLNYRLNLPDDVVRAAIAAGSFESLLASDQLVSEQARGNAFRGWTEAPVTFPPTYKYRPGTNQYSGGAPGEDEGEGDEGNGEPGNNGASSNNGDSSSQRKVHQVKVSAKEEKKKRTPAWCDRVLWKGRDIRQLSYDAVAALKTSDHKPVKAEFRLTARELQPERLESVLQELRRRLDAAEMASQPRCTLENPAADLGEMRFAERKRTTFRLVNTGDVAARWRFVATHEGAVSPPWIALTPTHGRLLPGEEVEIEAEGLVRGGGAAGPAALAGAKNTSQGSGAAEAERAATAATGRARAPAEAAPPPHDPFAAPPKQEPVPPAGSMAEAARLAQARAVRSGIAKAADGGGVSVVAPSERTPSRAGSGADLTALGGGDAHAGTLRDAPAHPLDAIVVLHLEGGRDFFLTVSGTLAPSVFGVPLGALSRASFPPDVPEPVGAIVDHLFSVGVTHPSLFATDRADEPGSLAGLAATRAALDAGNLAKTASDLSNVPAADAAHALLTLFAALPAPLLATEPRCAAAVDAAMAPWAAGRRRGGVDAEARRGAVDACRAGDQGAAPLAGSRGGPRAREPARAGTRRVRTRRRAVTRDARGAARRASRARPRAVRGGVVPGELGRGDADGAGRVPRRAVRRAAGVPGWV